ncbi:transposase, partial [Streptomyces formicae]
MPWSGVTDVRFDRSRRVTTRPWIVDDGLWARIGPLLPSWPERAPGPEPVDDRLCLQGISYVLHQDIACQLLPLELGFGSGQTCWRRLDRWKRVGVFEQLHRTLLAELHAAGELDWTRACVDGFHVRAKKEGAATGPSPVDRRKTGSKHHLICDSTGTPWTARVRPSRSTQTPTVASVISARRRIGA